MFPNACAANLEHSLGKKRIRNQSFFLDWFPTGMEGFFHKTSWTYRVVSQFPHRIQNFPVVWFSKILVWFSQVFANLCVPDQLLLFLLIWYFKIRSRISILLCFYSLQEYCVYRNGILSLSRKVWNLCTYWNANAEFWNQT